MNNRHSTPNPNRGHDETVAPQNTEAQNPNHTSTHGSFGHYKITKMVGRGAMGVVYEAVDPQLNRTVAIKTLTEGFAGDEDMVSRFSREASLLASLNHPHIATVYNHEILDGQYYLVMEFVEGEGLDQLIEHSRLSIKESLQLGRQIASALESAHNHGVIHRDLKPANIRVTGSFTVKVLDFGLAKQVRLVDPGSGSSVPDAIQTVTGQILGTPAYMSPEQARGRNLDKRTDLWSFGCILFEMLTGQPAFGGDTVTDTLVAIIEREPNWSLLPPQTPPGIQKLLERCLQKDADMRLPDAGTVRLDIEETLSLSSSTQAGLSTQSTESLHVPLPVQPKSKRNMITLSACLVLGTLLGAIMTLMLWNIPVTPPITESPASASPTPVLRHSYHLPNKHIERLYPLAHLGMICDSLAISPDGTRIAFVAKVQTGTQLFVRNLNEFDALAIPDTDTGQRPFFSPDGLSLGFFTKNELKTVAIERGRPVTLCEARNAVGASWGKDGVIYFVEYEGNRVSSVKGTGGNKLVIYDSVDPLEWPSLLPDGKGLLLTEWFTADHPSNSYDYSRIVYLPLESPKLRLLYQGGYCAKYSESGHLLFQRGDSLMAVLFDPNTLTTGNATAVPVVSEVLSQQYAISSNGTLVYISGRDNLQTVPVWLDRKGNMQPTQIKAGDYGTFDLSPDNSHIAIHVNGPSDQIHIFNLETGGSQRIQAPGTTRWPIWHGTDRILFAWFNENNHSLAIKEVGTSNPPDILTTKIDSSFPDCISPDGSIFFYHNWATNADMRTVSLDPPYNQQDLIATEHNEWGTVISPDSRWIAYTSDHDGQYNIYVRSFPLSDSRLWKVSQNMGEEPSWSPTTNELFYRNGSQFMSVQYEIESESEFKFQEPRVAFEGRLDNVPGISYRIANDGQRILVLKPVFDVTQIVDVRIVHNWFTELTRLVPSPVNQPLSPLSTNR